jgi:hypothetical protein
MTRVVADHPRVFEGKTTGQWREQLSQGDVAASRRANLVLNTAIIPQLTETALHDTNDSAFKLAVVDLLNQLPGIHVRCRRAPARRADALVELGRFGPAAKAAIPVLLQILKGHDPATRGAAAAALGGIHSDPDAVIPALIACLEDSDMDESAAEALGNFGPLAKAAVPKMLPLLLHGDKETRHAAALAVPRIDPEAAANAPVTELSVKLLMKQEAARVAASQAGTAAEKPK